MFRQRSAASPRLVAALAFLSCLFLFAPSSHAARPGSPTGGLQLKGENVVPGPGEFGALVTGTVSFGRGEACFEFTVGTLSGRITHIGIYQGRAGFDGAEVVTLNPMPPGIMGLRGCVPVDREVARAISRDKSGYYVMFVTDAYPNGAVRAQLGK
jgi:hypothetical protein